MESKTEHRQPGYYWVKASYRGDRRWVVAEWTKRNAWYIPGQSGDIPVNDNRFEVDIKEINETRIMNPDEYTNGLNKIREMCMEAGHADKVIIATQAMVQEQFKPITRCVGRDGKTWDELTDREKEKAKRDSIPG
jgi:hypothetical protein